MMAIALFMYEFFPFGKMSLDPRCVVRDNRGKQGIPGRKV